MGKKILIITLLTMAICIACAPMKWGYYRSQAQIWDDDFIELTNEVTDFPLVGGNKIELLVNGDEIFPAMFGAMEKAKDSIHVETYILYEDALGIKLCELLMEKARAGVEVRLIYDYFGERLSDDMRKKLTDAGVRHYRFNDWSWFHMRRGSNRTHRKILVVDGKIAFTGGVGFANEWMGNARDEHEYRDTHILMEGPIVNQLQEMFADNWEGVSGRRLAGSRYFPKQPTMGTVLAATNGRFTDEKDWSKTREMFLLALAGSRQYFYMNNAYFVPDPDCYKALSFAVKRGVDVKVILPGPETDLPATRLVAQKNYGKMIKAGIKIYEYQGTLMHAKTFVADGLLSMVGAANYTNRAFQMNHESNVLIYDEKFAEEMEHLFEIDLARSNQINYTEWQERRLTIRLYEQILGVIEGWY